MDKNEYKVKEVFNNKSEDLEKILERIFMHYCMEKLEKNYRH